MQVTLSLPVWFIGDKQMNPIAMMCDAADFVPLFREKEIAVEALRDMRKKDDLVLFAIKTAPLLLNFIDNMMNARKLTHFGLDPKDGKCSVIEEFATLRRVLTGEAPKDKK